MHLASHPTWKLGKIQVHSISKIYKVLSYDVSRKLLQYSGHENPSESLIIQLFWQICCFFCSTALAFKWKIKDDIREIGLNMLPFFHTKSLSTKTDHLFMVWSVFWEPPSAFQEEAINVPPNQPHAKLEWGKEDYMSSPGTCFSILHFRLIFTARICLITFHKQR